MSTRCVVASRRRPRSRRACGSSRTGTSPGARSRTPSAPRARRGRSRCRTRWPRPAPPRGRTTATSAGTAGAARREPGGRGHGRRTPGRAPRCGSPPRRFQVGERGGAGPVEALTDDRVRIRRGRRRDAGHAGGAGDRGALRGPRHHHLQPAARWAVHLEASRPERMRHGVRRTRSGPHGNRHATGGVRPPGRPGGDRDDDHTDERGDAEGSHGGAGKQTGGGWSSRSVRKPSRALNDHAALRYSAPAHRYTLRWAHRASSTRCSFASH